MWMLLWQQKYWMPEVRSSARQYVKISAFQGAHLHLPPALFSILTIRSSMPWINQEVTHLESMIEDVAGPLAADGGYLAEDIYGNLPDLGWDNLTKKFLKT